MKKFLLSLIIFLLLASPAWGATYYVSPTGTNTSPYDTWTKAANELSTVIALNAGGGPHTVYVAPGSYAKISTSSTAWNSASIIGVAAHGNTTEATMAQLMAGIGPYIAVTGANNAFVTSGGIASFTLKNFELKGPTTGVLLYVRSGSNFHGKNLYIHDSSSYLYLTDAAHLGILIDYSFIGGTSGATAVGISTGGGGTFQYNIFGPTASNNLTGTDGQAITVISSPDSVNFYNNVITSHYGTGLNFSGTGKTFNVKNNYIGPPIARGRSTIAQVNGTVNLANNIYVGGWDGTAITSGTITDMGGNQIGVSPKFVKTKRIGVLLIGIDDSAAIDSAWFDGLEASLAARGMKATFYINGRDATTYAIKLAAVHSRGVFQIADHGYSHSYLDLTGTAWTVTKAEKTINVDRAADTITVSDTVTVTGFKAKTLTAIRAELAAGGVTNGTLLTNLVADAKGEVLADSAGAQASPYNMTLLIDATGATGFFKAELADSQAAIEAVTGAGTVNTLGTPGTTSTANMITAAKTIGYTAVRGKQITSNTNWILSSYNRFSGACLSFTYLADADLNVVKQNAREMALMAMEGGGVLWLFGHYNAGSPELSNDQFDAVLDALLEFPSDQLKVMGAEEFSTYIATPANGWVTADDITYTRGIVAGTVNWAITENYHLQAGSLAINAGVDVGLTGDYVGNPKSGSAWDIGAYEFQHAKGGLAPGMGMAP